MNLKFNKNDMFLRRFSVRIVNFVAKNSAKHRNGRIAICNKRLVCFIELAIHLANGLMVINQMAKQITLH